MEGAEVRHVRNVLRLNRGDPITVFDGSGKEYEGTIVGLQSSHLTILVEKVSSPARESHLRITLAQSLLKGEKMDTLIQKATELGVTEIIPFSSARSVPVLSNPRRAERRRRWEKIAIEASKQCGRDILPNIHSLQTYGEMLQRVEPESLRLILWEREGLGLKEVLKGSVRMKKVFFIVGPEGGLTQVEIEEAKGKDFIPVFLGKRILRSETAGLCLLSILQYEWGDVG